MYGASLFGGGSIAYAIVQLVREQPERAFELMTSWGPGYVLALLVAYALHRLLDKAVDAQSRSNESNAGAIRDVAVEMRRVAEATNAQALALQKTADKDDREKQEMQTLIGVVNSKVDQTLDEQKRQNRALERIEDALNINRPEGSESK
jgi:hypothetical protein